MNKVPSTLYKRLKWMRWAFDTFFFGTLHSNKIVDSVWAFQLDRFQKYDAKQVSNTMLC